MLGIGVDICEVHRFDRLKENSAFLNKIFTDEEIAHCSKKKTSSQCFAARFAAKEAFAKAVGTGFRKGVHFKDIQIKNDNFGKPYLDISGETDNTLKKINAGKLHLSISHEKTSAIAFVLIENGENSDV